MINKTALILPVLFSIAISAHAEVQRVTGTYSNLEYHRQAGDLNGMEIRVVLTRDGYKATVQVAEGGAGDIFIVPFKKAGDRVEFDVPLPGGREGGHFSGGMTERGLKGVIRYPSGVSEKVLLPRKKSYWE